MSASLAERPLTSRLGPPEREEMLRRPAPLRRRRRLGILPLLLLTAVKAISLVGAPVALAAWICWSPYFQVRELSVAAGPRVGEEWVRERLAPLVGRHLLMVSLDGVRRQLAAHPWVASVELRKELPRRLDVRVVERRPAALLLAPDGAWFLDEAGERIARCPRPEAAPELLPIAASAAGDAALPVVEASAVARELAAVEPAWAAAIERMEVLGQGDYRVTSGALPFPVLLAAADVAGGARRLRVALAAAEERGFAVGEADLRVGQRVVFRPGPRPTDGAEAGNGNIGDTGNTEG